MKRIALAATLAVTSFAAIAGPAAADPVATLCGSINVTINGQALVTQDQCQVLPPEQQ